MNFKFKPLSAKDIIDFRLREEDDIRIKKMNESGDIKIKEIKENSFFESALEIRQKKEKKMKALGEFSNKIKKTLLCEAILHIYDKALAVNEGSEYDRSIKYNYIYNFVEENGVQNLLNKFDGKTPFLTEVSQLVTSYHKKIMEDAKDNDSDQDDLDVFTIGDQDIQDFFDELDTSEVDTIADTIKMRVSDAISQFVEDNKNDKDKIKDIISNIQGKIDSTDGEIKESYELELKRRTKNIRYERNQSVFEHMVLSISEAAVKNPEIGTNFIYENKLNIDKVMEAATVMYTFLEMVNSTKMVKVDEDYIQNVIKELKS